MFFQMLLLVNGLESQMFHSCLEKLGWGLSTLCFIVRPSQLDKKVIVKRQKKEFFSTAPWEEIKAQVNPKSVFGIPAWGSGFSKEQAVSIATQSCQGVVQPIRIIWAPVFPVKWPHRVGELHEIFQVTSSSSGRQQTSPFPSLIMELPGKIQCPDAHHFNSLIANERDPRDFFRTSSFLPELLEISLDKESDNFLEPREAHCHCLGFHSHGKCWAFSVLFCLGA